MNAIVPQGPPVADYEVVIVGSGFAGLCMGVRLRQAGIEDFVILEKDREIGGTWRDNRYPGCACDVPSHLYSFSFAQNPAWSRKYPRQGELLAYTREVAEQFGLVPHVRLGAGLQAATWDAARGRWRLRTAAGEMTARTLVLGLGALGRPALPKLRGLAEFTGKTFHSARWDHGYDLTGKRIAVIGTGASAIQFVPEIAGKVARLDLYQRTPPWIVPRPDRAITGAEQWLMRKLPGYQQLFRGLLYLQHEVRVLGFVVDPRLMKLVRLLALRHIRSQISDPELRRKVTPDYMIGCKRILVMNEYYPALTRPNVEVIVDGIREVTANGIVDMNGETREVDAIIFGTGFDLADPLAGIPVAGVDGRDLHQTWQQDGISAYLGCAIAGFPNLFMVAGPNTGLGHNSMIYMIESAVNYVVDAVRTLRRRNLRAVDVQPEVQRAYNQRMQRRLGKAVWASGCKSWYLGEDGKNFTLWPGFTFEYRWATRRFDLENYYSEAATAQVEEYA
jgi:cation diffusion facilitator CzcD-associated flavoprotein CzcO